MAKYGIIAAAILCIAASTPVFAHDNATGIVKERMELMKSIGRNMKTLGKMFKGQETYDPAAIQQAAGAISNLAGSKMTGLFPEHEFDHPSEALPVIHEQWERFEHLAKLAADYSSILKAAAGNPLEQAANAGGEIDIDRNDREILMSQAPIQAFRHLAKTCSACHETYRMKKD